MMSSRLPRVKLNNGILMPLIGFGTYKIQGNDTISMVLDAALAAGYRAIDTASVYKNEESIGACLSKLLPKYNLKRDDIFITSKLAPRDQGNGKCREAFQQSLSRLGLEYLDLYLIHWPGSSDMKPQDKRNRELRQQSWYEMESLIGEGKVKAIGISNYHPQHLKELLGYCKIRPAVLQNEHHPHLIQKEVMDLCFANNIHYQAYSSLGTSAKDNPVLSDPVIQKIAEKYEKSVAQILLRWAVQHDVGIIPKSTNPEHIADNCKVFDFQLSAEDLDKIDLLNKQHHYCWNASEVF